MTWRYRPELDGLRTIAVYLVLLYHSGMAWAGGGFIGVDLFFVLSGFLVTNVILSGVDRDGTVRLADFYARRVRRLLPAAVAVIVVTSLVFVLTASLPERLPMVRDAQSALVYLSNWHFIASASDYFATDTEKSPFLHFWSLSIEEQFYVFFPLLLLVMTRLARSRERLLLWLLVALGAASLVAQLVVARVNVDRAYYGTDTRLYQLLAGAALAVAFREVARAASSEREGGRRAARADESPAAVPGSRIAPWVALLGVGSLLLLGSGAVPVSVSVRGVLATVASLAAIGGLFVASGCLLGRVLSRPTPVFLGKISYGTYLWHWPVLLVLGGLFDVRPLVLALLAAAVATGLAALSYEVLERPIREARALRGPGWRSVAGGLVLSLLVAGLVVGPVLKSHRAPVVAAADTGSAAILASKDVARKLDRPVPRDLDFEKIAGDHGPAERWCTPSSVEDCVKVPNDGPHVLLVGDSQARVLAAPLSRLAEEKGFQLSLSIVTSCPWQNGLYNYPDGQETADQLQCREAREGLYTESLKKMDVDLVIVAALARSDEHWQGTIVDEDNKPRPVQQLVLDTTRHTADLVHDAGADLVIVKSMMGTDGYDIEGWDPLDCLARAKKLGDCVVVPHADKPVADSFYDTLATDRDDVATIDINPLACPDAPTCLPILDGRVVWRNNNHFTAKLLRHLSPQIWDEIEQTGLAPGR